MTKNTKTIIGVGAGILLLLYLRNRNKSTETLKDADAGNGSTGGGGGGGGIGLGKGVTLPNNNPTSYNPSTLVVNVTKPLFQPLNSTSTSPVSPRPYTSPIDLRPATSPNTTEAVSQAPLRSSFLTFDGTFRNASGLDFDGNIID